MSGLQTLPTPMEKLELRKDIVLNLKKDLGISTQKAQVVLALDYSGSMTPLYNSGEVQELVERVLPLGLGFDDNGEVDTYLFHNNASKIDRNITLSNFRGYVDKYLWDGTRRAPRFSMGGTSYAPIIGQIVSDFIGTQGAKKGLISRVFGSGSEAPGTLEYPVYVIFVTDGENDDHARTEAAMRAASEYGIFFQFVGIGNEKFKFLDKLDTLSGRKLDNANFFKTPDLSKISDEDLYKMMLSEFKDYPALARKEGMIK